MTKKFKKLFSVVLALAMAVCMLPLNSMTVKAGAGSGSTYADVDIKRSIEAGFKWTAGGTEVVVGDVITNCTFVNEAGGNLHADKTSYLNVDNTKVSGTVVKIDGFDLYLCSASDHETKKAENGLCPTCDPDSGSGGSGSEPNGNPGGWQLLNTFQIRSTFSPYNPYRLRSRACS